MVVLSVALSSGLTAACDTPPDGVQLLAQASFVEPSARFFPNPIAFTPVRTAGCFNGGFAVASSFHLIITAGLRDLTLDHATVRLLDGSNLGGPSITIPRTEFASHHSSLFIPAGTANDFLVSPNFGCSTTQPVALSVNTFLFDSQGMMVTIPVEGRVR